MDWPLITRSMEMPLSFTVRPEAGMPKIVPVCTPPKLQRVTTLLPSTIWSSTVSS
jgi:hypothetical protein